MRRYRHFAKIGKNVGIHFVLATSRPCSNVITEGLKTNISCSIAFRVVRKIDSYTFLNEAGAEGLSCRGDALLKIDDGSLIGVQNYGKSWRAIFPLCAFGIMSAI